MKSPTALKSISPYKETLIVDGKKVTVTVNTVLPSITVLTPTHKKAKKLTQEDVWGKWSDHYPIKQLKKGMIVARTDQKCPVWKDKVPYKSVTVMCLLEQEGDVSYWLEFVQGGNCISKRKVTTVAGQKMVALRSDYQAW